VDITTLTRPDAGFHPAIKNLKMMKKVHCWIPVFDTFSGKEAARKIVSLTRYFRAILLKMFLNKTNSTYDLLEGVLAIIEKKLQEGINADPIAGEFDISLRHLQRLFKIVFNKSIGSYIRSRKLAASINDLLNTDMNVLDIALDYGFEYEQSYIRSFKREYGITPGDLRKTGKILKITPPLNLFNSHKYSNEIN